MATIAIVITVVAVLLGSAGIYSARRHAGAKSAATTLSLDGRG